MCAGFLSLVEGIVVHAECRLTTPVVNELYATRARETTVGVAYGSNCWRC